MNGHVPVMYDASSDAPQCCAAAIPADGSGLDSWRNLSAISTARAAVPRNIMATFGLGGNTWLRSMRMDPNGRHRLPWRALAVNTIETRKATEDFG